MPFMQRSARQTFVCTALALVTLAVCTPTALAQSTDPEASEQAPGVTMPEILHFESAPYPKQAQEQGLSGDVILRLTVEADGSVSDVEVVEPLGHGFDEAASVAAYKFRFKPATKDGEAVRVQILYRYGFTLKEAPPEERPVEQQLPKVGNLTGELRVSGSESPLAGAQVAVTGADGQTLVFTSDAGGRFTLEGLSPGVYRVVVTADGFISVEIDETVVAGEATQVIYRLAPEQAGIEITVRGERPPREVTRRTIERREINRIPGTSGDALRSIQSLPGVARPPGLAGLLIVRGSAPEDTAVFIDGGIVPIIYHFGGLSSVVPTELLDRIDFYPGNFGVKYGQVMGGIVDVGLRSPDVSCTADYGKPSDEQGCYHGMAQVDMIDARLMLQGPLFGAKDWSFALAGRRSWIDTWIKPVLEEAGAGVTSAPVYSDYQIIVDHAPSEEEKLSLRFYGSSDELEILITDPAAQDPAFGGNLVFATSFYRGQVLYTDQLAKDVKLTSMVSAGRDVVDFSLGNNFLFQVRLYPISLRSEFGFKLTRGVQLNTGMDLLTVPFEVLVRAPPPPRPGEPDPGPFATKPPVETSDKGTGFRPGWYADLELQPTERLRIVPGARLDYARDSGHRDFSPRVNARYKLVEGSDPDDPSKEGLGTTLKGGVGLFHQPPQFQETNEVFGTPDLLSNRAIHYSLGVEQQLSTQIELSVEGFYKDLTQLVSRETSPNGAFVYGNEGTGDVIGLETLLKYKPDQRFFGWVAYTLSRSRRKDGPSEPEYLMQFDQTHNLIILGSYRLGRGWEFGARFRVVSGPLTTPVLPPPALPALYAADAGAYTPLQGLPFSRRLPLFHQLDVRVDKRWQFRTWRLSAYLDIQNAYNHQSVEALVYNYNFSQSSYQTGLPIIPSFGVRGEF